MIDVLLLLSITLLFVVIPWRKRLPQARELAIALAMAFALHTLTITFLYWPAKLSFSHVFSPSYASQQKVGAEGEVLSINGRQVSSLGSAAGRALASSRSEILTSSGAFAFEHRGASLAWRFWEPIDSYRIEEAFGGLALLPRNPVILSKTVGLQSQISSKGLEGVRIVSLSGVRSREMADVLNAFSPAPANGVSLMRVMKPSPDAGVHSILVSPRMFSSYGQLSGLGNREAFSRFAGFSGIPLYLWSPEGLRFQSILLQVGEDPAGGPSQFFQSLREYHPAKGPVLLRFLESWQYYSPLAADEITYVLRPRLAILPWIHENLFFTLTAGYLGLFVRQVVGMSSAGTIFSLWELIPKQHYLLDDGIIYQPLYLLHKATGVMVSFAIGLAVVLLLRKTRLLKGPLHKRGPSWALTLALVFLLQAGELFVFHVFRW